MTRTPARDSDVGSPNVPNAPNAPAVPIGPEAGRYGWVVVALAFTILSLVGGLTFYAMSAYINALVSERGFSLQVASAGPTMSAVFGGFGGLATARLMRTVSTRLIMAVGALGLGISVFGIGSSHAVWQLWGAFALSGWFSAMTSVIPVSSLVARWFPDAPARPLTLAMTGLSVGGAVVPPAVLGVLGAYGLTIGSAVLGGTVVVLIAVAVVFVKEPPARPAAAASGVVPGERPSLTEKRFVLLFLGMTCLFLSQVATTAHLVRLAEEDSIGGAALAVSILALGSFSGRIVGMPLLPRIGLRRLAVGVGVVQAAGQLMLSLSHTEVQLCVGTYLLGLAMGNVSILQSLFTIEAYGLDAYPWVLSRLSLADPIGAGLGPLLVGLMHGWFEGYQWALITMGVLSALGAVGLFLTGVDSPSTLRRRHGRR
ncbi:MFS transporter [Streptomyces phaeochromogenes]|uniref:MFS transporter n=1 Tax=Streptomyces phaeochromogenes TaxID=1923 RepID=UPI0036C0A499